MNQQKRIALDVSRLYGFKLLDKQLNAGVVDQNATASALGGKIGGKVPPKTEIQTANDQDSIASILGGKVGQKGLQSSGHETINI